MAEERMWILKLSSSMLEIINEGLQEIKFRYAMPVIVEINKQLDKQREIEKEGQ